MKYIFTILGASIITLTVAAHENPFRRSSGARSFIVAHGGCKRLFPENTMTAFDGSVRLGVDILEMDIVVTADSVPITFHDESLDRTTDGTGSVYDYTLEQLRGFNFGYNFKGPEGGYPYRDSIVPVTALEQVIEKYGADYPLFIEIKSKGEYGRVCARRLASLISNYSIGKTVVVSCFDDDIIDYFRGITAGEVQTAMGAGATKKFIVSVKTGTAFLRGTAHSSIQVPVERSGFRLDKRRIVKVARRKGLTIYYWTINDPQKMRELILLGADGIITDRPDLMRTVLEELVY